MAKNIPLTEFDIFTLNPIIQIVKAIIPFLEIQTQKQLALMIRFYELHETIQFYNNSSKNNPFTSACDCNKPIHSISDIIDNEEILQEIVKHCPDNIASLINTYKQYSKISNMTHMFDNIFDSSSDNSFDNLFSNMFDNSPDKACYKSGQKIDNGTSHNPLNAFMSNMCNKQQQASYEKYMKDLEKINFDEIN